MEYGNCTCQASCEDPENVLGCQTTCTEEEMCICREGFLKEGEDCVPPAACSCYMEGEGVVRSGNSKYYSSLSVFHVLAVICELRFCDLVVPMF